MTDSTRSIERTLNVATDPDTVWRALTDAEQIGNWFAPDAESEPGPGGVIRLRWDPAGGEYQTLHIKQWQPGQRLLTTWRDAPGGEHELPLDITLQASSTGTTLRLVHSGFLSDASWDDEFESHGRGWSYELRSLKYYLENHLDQARSFVLRRVPLAVPFAEARRHVLGPAGEFRFDAVDAREGDEISLTLPNGDQTLARVMVGLTDVDFAVITDALDGGVIRFAFETFSGQPELWLWAFGWGVAERRLQTFAEPCFDAVSRALATLRTSQAGAAGR